MSNKTQSELIIKCLTTCLNPRRKMENNKENQDCMAQQNATPEKKKKGFVRKYVVPGLAIVGGITVAYLLDEKCFGGKGRKFIAKQGKNAMGKFNSRGEINTHVEHREHKPAVMETVFIAATEAPTYGGKRPERSFQDNGNRAADNKHYNNVQRKN